jgi:DNA-3-methyladenine glycosylase
MGAGFLEFFRKLFCMSLILEKSFYNDYTPKVARKLLGCYLIREIGDKVYKGVITETEGYRGFHDLASHASCGKTKRNEVMFESPGRVYVYLVYGMHWMLNVVTEEEGYPAAVLIRGLTLMDKEGKFFKQLDGPGKLTREIKIEKSLNGQDVTVGDKLWIEEKSFFKNKKIIRNPRVGVDYARHCRHWKWNFKLKIN